MSPPWLNAARADLGVTEVKGKRHNERILELARLAGVAWVKDDETAWCATSVGGWLVEGGQTSSGSAAARSYLEWGVGIPSPVPGAVVVFPRGKNPAFGHVGIVETVDIRKGTMVIVNGNVSDSVRRSTRRINEVLPGGIRWPKGYPLPGGVLSRDVAPAKRYQLGQRTLSIGMRGDDVAEWQRILREFGYPAEVDGIYGAQTRDSTLQRQRRAGILEDGIAGPATISATQHDLDVRRATSRKADQQATGAGKGGIAGGIGGAAIGVGGAAVVVDQGADAAGKVKDLLSPGIGEIVILVAIIAGAAFALWYLVIRPRRTKEPESTARERRILADPEVYPEPDDAMPVDWRGREVAG